MIYVAFKWTNGKKYGDGWQTRTHNMPQNEKEMLAMIDSISQGYNKKYEVDDTSIVIYYMHELNKEKVND